MRKPVKHVLWKLVIENEFRRVTYNASVSRWAGGNIIIIDTAFAKVNTTSKFKL